MKKSINLYFNNKINTKQKLLEIKNSGYEEFFTGIFDGEETLSLTEQIDYAKSIGLGLTMIHCAYYDLKLDSFWEEGSDGEEVKNEYIRQISKCGTLTSNFVIHLHLTQNYKTSRIGLHRINELLKECEKYNVNLAVENLLKEDDIKYIFSNISHPLLKICYDCGHQNFATPDFDLMKNYGKYVSVLHIHDNNGILDEHKIIGEGTINIENLAKNLSEFPNLTLASEIKYPNEDYRLVIKRNFEALTNLEKLVYDKI